MRAFGRSGRRSRPSISVAGRRRSCPLSAVAGLLSRIRDRYGVAPDAEVTLEANPGPDERGDAAALRAAGVTRLSIGAQAMSAAGLRRLGRRHRVVDVVTAVADARAGGIASVSLDLLYDVPDASLGDWIDTLDAALALAPDHLSLYALTLDDPDAEGLTGPGGDHLPTTAGARRWRATRATRPGRGSGGGAVPPRRPSAGRRRLARLRDQQLGAPGAREPAQPRLLGAPAIRGGRARGARVRWRHPALERGTTRWLHRGAGSGRRRRPAAPARRLRGDRPGDGRGRGGHPRAADRSRRPARRGVGGAARGRVRMGAGRRAPRRDRRRSGRPDDPRPTALERAVQPPGLTGRSAASRASRAAASSRLAVGDSEGAYDRAC